MSKTNDLSPAKLLANLLNAQLSTGPKTEAGKAKSKMNAMRHGLTGQFYVMNEPDRVAYNAFEKEMLQGLSPVGIVEQQVAIAITQNTWRLNRARALEFNLYGVGHEDEVEATNAGTAEVEAAITQAKTWLSHHPAIANLTLYEARIENSITKAEKRLEHLQSTRKANENKALAEAELLICHAALKNETLELGKALEASSLSVAGFDFSAATVLSGMKHKAAVTEAQYYQNRGWSNTEPFHQGPFWPVLTKNPLPKAA